MRRPLTPEQQTAATLMHQLGLVSLERMKVSLDVEQRFGFSSDLVPANEGQLWAVAQGLVEVKTVKPPPPLGFRPPSDEGPPRMLGDTLAAAFVNRALANPRDVVVADDLAGVRTYARLLVGALVLWRRFPGPPALAAGV